MSMRIIKPALAGIVALGLAGSAFGAEPVSIEDLLKVVKQGRAKDEAEFQARMKDFQSDRSAQQKKLNDMKAERVNQEKLSAQLEATFEKNDAEIMDLERHLKERLGDLKELFGVLQQAAGDARGNFDNSLTQIQFPERSEWLTAFAQKMGQTTRLPKLEEIERVWFELMREAAESGKVVKFKTDVVDTEGKDQQEEITRVGLFNLVNEQGKYLEYVPETGRVVELQRQPQSRYVRRAAAFEEATSGLAPFAIDPTRGQLLALLVQTPSFAERVSQGQSVGYTIIVLGVIGLIIALWRLIVLAGISAKVRRQTKDLDHPGNNPLGRVLKVAVDHPDVDVESLELRLDEQILKETPKLNSMIPLLKIIAVVAPLLGLLGTVIGMIITFQAITLYGAGDPKLMAGGISTALVTTVEGLVVAIPTVFLQALVSSRAKNLTQILQEEAAGMLSERAETKAQA